MIFQNQIAGPKFVVFKNHIKEDIEELIDMLLDNVQIPQQSIDIPTISGKFQDQKMKKMKKLREGR